MNLGSEEALVNRSIHPASAFTALASTPHNCVFVLLCQTKRKEFIGPAAHCIPLRKLVFIANLCKMVKLVSMEARKRDKFMTGQNQSTSEDGSESMLNNRSAWRQIGAHTKETIYLNASKMPDADVSYVLSCTKHIIWKIIRHFTCPRTFTARIN